MDKLNAMRAFVEIADQGSLTAAADVLGKAQPTMVRTLARLEESLGVRLLRRTTRRLSLTEEGESYLARCRQILADVEEAERALTVGDTEPRGTLRVTAPVTFGQWHVAPAIVDFLERYPRVRVELLLLDRVINFLEEGIDLAVRIGTLEDSSMIAAKVGTMRRVVVASPGLLAEHHPERPEDLEGAPAVLFRGMQTTASWQFETARTEAATGTGAARTAEDQRRTAGGPVIVKLRTPLITNQCIPAVEACAAGLGFGRFLAYQVAPWVRRGELEVILEAWEPEPSPVSLLYTDARLMTPRLRVLMAHLRERLGELTADGIL